VAFLVKNVLFSSFLCYFSSDLYTNSVGDPNPVGSLSFFKILFISLDLFLGLGPLFLIGDFFVET
jgi:hypothetical protein